MQIAPPKRVSRSYAQRLTAPSGDVFPLLCPVRECDWIEGWEPVMVASYSGVAEDDCVFVTPSQPANTFWYVSRHEAEKGFVEMIRITPDITACRLSIRLEDAPHGCTAHVTYTHTSLGPSGDAFIADFTEAYYTRAMQDWEKRINHYMATGNRLPA